MSALPGDASVDSGRVGLARLCLVWTSWDPLERGIPVALFVVAGLGWVGVGRESTDACKGERLAWRRE